MFITIEVTEDEVMALDTIIYIADPKNDEQPREILVANQLAHKIRSAMGLPAARFVKPKFTSEERNIDNFIDEDGRPY